MFCYCYDDKQIIATVYSFDYCSLITVLFHMIFKINISQDFDDINIKHNFIFNNSKTVEQYLSTPQNS